MRSTVVILMMVGVATTGCGGPHVGSYAGDLVLEEGTELPDLGALPLAATVVLSNVDGEQAASMTVGSFSHEGEEPSIPTPLEQASGRGDVVQGSDCLEEGDGECLSFFNYAIDPDGETAEARFEFSLADDGIDGTTTYTGTLARE